MSKTPRTVAIPGAPVAASQVDHDQAGADAGADAGGADQGNDTQAADNTPLADGADDQAAELAALRKQLAAANAALKAQSQQSKQAPSMAKPVGGGAVLTDRGYVVPENYGTPQQKKA